LRKALLGATALFVFAAIGFFRPFERLVRPNLDTTGGVTEVFDGDTVKLADGRIVRYVGIDCPEMDSARRDSRAFAHEARELNRTLVGNREVRLEFDVETMDKYGRCLAYVWVGEKMTGAELVAAGLARARSYGVNTKHEALLKGTEEQARNAGRGIWAAGNKSER
jgi:micrococcal nuclease